jgi:DNA-binding transcriptional LysR family regulator
MNLNETLAFVAVARSGSFTAAARALDLPKATISRRVSRLEARLGARLLQRTTRRTSLTESGEAYFKRSLHAIETIENAERFLTDVTGTASGTLRVTSSFDFGRDYLASWLPEFHRRFPEVRLELELTQRRVDLVAEGLDVAIRGGTLPDSSLVARKLFESGLVLCASPAYLRRHGTPRSPADLRDHRCLTPGTARFRLSAAEGSIEIESNGWLSVNEFGVLQQAVLAGSGIGLLEINAIDQDLKRGKLRRVLPEFAVGGGGLFAVYPSSHHLSPKVRVFVDFIAEMLSRTRGPTRSRRSSSPSPVRR